MRSLALQPRTLKRYEGAVSLFFAWLEAAREALPATPEAMDEILAEYLEDCWAQGLGRGKAADSLSGLQHFVPSLRRSLKDSWRLLGVWSKNEVPTRVLPLLPDQALAMAGFALSDGDVCMAAAVLVAFNRLLRPSEVMVTRSQRTFDFDQGTCHIELGYAKGGQRSGVPEHVVIDELEGVLLLARAPAHKAPGDFLFPRGVASFRRAFRGLVERIGADPSKVLPYSLRRGGATHHWRTLANLSATCIRGRWRQQTTCRIYIQDGVAMLENLALSASQRRLIAEGKSLLRRLA